MSNLQVFVALLGFAVLLMSTAAGFGWWLSNQFKETRHSLRGAMDMRFGILDEKIDNLEKRVRELEIGTAKRHSGV